MTMIVIHAQAEAGRMEGREKNRRTLEPPFAMPEITEPVFPPRTFDIRDFGATREAGVLNTGAISRAIEKCAAEGGGRVLIPEGIWRTGPVHLRSNVNLHLADKAVLDFSDRFEDYLPAVLVMRGGVEAYSYSPLIYARNCENIAVTGRGTLNGNGGAWWQIIKYAEREGGALQKAFDMAARGEPAERRVFATRESGLRPHFIQPMDCRNVLLEDFTLKDAPAWNINPIRCENLTVRGVAVQGDGPNNDGIDPEMCRNVLIEDCFLDTGDDCIAIKSGRDAEAWRMNRSTENVIIRRIRTARGHGGIVIGSEISGGVRNVFAYDCHFAGTDVGLRIKTNPGRGGFIEGLWFQDITMQDIRDQAIIVTMSYGHGFGSLTDRRTKIQGLHFKNISSTGAKKGISLRGDAKLPPRDLVFENIRCEGGAGFVCENVERLSLRGVKLDQEGPAFLFRNSREVALHDIGGKGEPLITIEGHGSGAFTMPDIDPQRIAISDGADPARVKAPR